MPDARTARPRVPGLPYSPRGAFRRAECYNQAADVVAGFLKLLAKAKA